MFKKVVTGIAGLAMFCMVGNAFAGDVHYSIAGASAQGKYWRSAGGAFLAEIYNCQGGTAVADQAEDDEDNAGQCLAKANTKNGVVRGLDCNDADGDGTRDTIYLHYLEIASEAGCNGAPGCNTENFVNTDTCDFSTGLCACENEAGLAVNAEVALPIDIGAADVACEDLNQITIGWEDGRSDFEDDPRAPDTFGPYDSVLGANMVIANPVVVPFGFIANNSVVSSRCTAPGHASAADAAHKAYDPFWNQCVKGNVYACAPNAGSTTPVCQGGPNNQAACTYKEECADASLSTSDDCIGYYKCGAIEAGKCPAGERAGLDCSKTSQCPDVAVATTYCENVPLDNLSRLQALLIFSNTVHNWNEFGPSYPDMLINKCMRHAGSGTHATLTKAVFRQKYNVDLRLWNTSVPASATGDVVWHYKSSSDLAADCVNELAGAVGYVDADKLLGKAYDNSHQMKYEGIEPTRMNVKNGAYSFWAEQNVFYDTTCHTAAQQTFMNALFTFAADPSNLREDNLGDTAQYWATQVEMSVTRNGDVDEFPQ